MIITSSSFDDGAAIPKKFTCEGGDMNPELLFQYVPPQAKSLALIIHDPDAPAEGGWTHWTVWNIDPRISSIKEESVPPGGIEGTTSADTVGYHGPCPPPGVPHHYHFHLYALDALLDLPEGADVSALRDGIATHMIAEADLVGMYGTA